MANDHGASIKDDRQYEALRDQGASKEKAARIANSDSSETGRRGGKADRYEDWSKDDLEQKARDVGIDGRSKMNKGELIDALRNHQQRAAKLRATGELIDALRNHQQRAAKLRATGELIDALRIH